MVKNAIKRRKLNILVRLLGNKKQRERLSAKREKERVKSKQGRIDIVFAILIGFLLIFGLIMVFDTSVVFSYAYFGDKYKFIVQQLMWAGAGIVAMVLTTIIPYKIYKVLTLPMLVLTVGLLVAVILFAGQVSGAQRWLDLGTFAIQPSELAKLTYIIYLAVWLSKERAISTWKQYFYNELLPFLLSTGVVSGLVLAGNDMGTAGIIFFISFIMYFPSAKTKIQKQGILVTIGLGVLAIAGFALLEPYRLARVTVFLDLLKGQIRDPTKSGFQIFQVLIAIGSGGLFGVGFTGSLQKYDLVETTASTDSIFAIIGEEFGFFISLAVIGLYLAIVLRGLRVAEKAKDRLGMMLGSGIAIWIGIQAFINIGANIGLIPLTGVPLPLISYGGSALVTLMTGLGILLNVSRNRSAPTADTSKPARRKLH